MRLVSLLLTLAALLGLSAQVQVVPFADAAGQLVVPASICGKSVRAVLDTGSSVAFAGPVYPGGTLLGPAQLPTLANALPGEWEECAVSVGGATAQVTGIVSASYHYLPLLGTPALRALGTVVVVVWPLRQVVLLQP